MVSQEAWEGDSELSEVHPGTRGCLGPDCSQLMLVLWSCKDACSAVSGAARWKTGDRDRPNRNRSVEALPEHDIQRWKKGLPGLLAGSSSTLVFYDWHGSKIAGVEGSARKRLIQGKRNTFGREVLDLVLQP